MKLEEQRCPMLYLKQTTPWEGWNTSETSLCSQDCLQRQLTRAGLPPQWEKGLHNTQARPGLPSLAGMLSGSPQSLCQGLQCSSISVVHFKAVLKIQARCDHVSFWNYVVKEGSQETTYTLHLKKMGKKVFKQETNHWRAITLSVQRTRHFPLCLSVTRR